MRRRIGSPDPFELADLRRSATGTARTSSAVVEGGAVVDEADRARPGRRSAGAAAPGSAIVGRPRRGCRRRPRRRSRAATSGSAATTARMAPATRGAGALAGGHGGAAGGQGPREHGGGRAARSADRRTLRLERASPSGSRTIGQPTTSTGSERSAAMRAHDGQLLEVLQAEVGPAGAGDGEQLGHHGGHAVEVARARGALPARR